MSQHPPGRPARTRLAIASVGVLGLVAAGFMATSATTYAAPSTAVSGAATKTASRPVQSPKAPTSYTAGRYIVMLRESAAVAFTGGRGYTATRATGGSQFRSDTAAVRRYTSHLRTSHRDLAAEFGATAVEDYTLASNGFVADLSRQQALDLATDRRVMLIEKQQLLKPTTWHTPTFLGLTGKNGAWTQHGGQKKAGDGIVVADIDSGIWPESKSFKGLSLTSNPRTKWDISRQLDHVRMEKANGGVFRGRCQLGAEWGAGKCTTKIIGARYYTDYVDQYGADTLADTEYISARDGSGHGSHTSSTAAGDITGNVNVEGRHFGKISGMAPAAKIAEYKVCYENTNPDDNGCLNTDIVAAVDDVVGDGADVINYSIGGGASDTLGADDLAFEGAAEAGIFVSASAGNSGPDAATGDHPGPWLTTVAASTAYNYQNTIVLGNGTKLAGASISEKPLPATPLVSSKAIVVAGGDADDAEICGPKTLDPAKAKGKIVVCLRGVYARVDKSAEVKRAGGVGMILVNPTEGGSLDADFHSVPTIHIDATPGKKVYAYLASASNPTAAFKLGNITKVTTPLPQVAGFSSRGPALVGNGDLLKPDISAPGVSVLAAVAPPSNSGRKYDLYSGTSMSAPHIAGLAAFMLSVHPTWTPMMIKSAMMTTAVRTKTESGGRSNDALSQGAGEVHPKSFFDPGLFVTARAQEWRGFLTQQGIDTGVAPIPPSTINLPTMAGGAVTGTASFVRSFRATRAGTWKISSNVPGFKLTTSHPTVVSKRKNDVIDMRFTFTRTNAALATYSQGAVTLTGPTSVRLPVALRAVAVDAPAKVAGTGTTGSVDVAIKAGSTGNLDLATFGLAKAQTTNSSVAAGKSELKCVTVTKGTKLARFDVDVVDNTADLDLFVYQADTCDPKTAFAVAGQSATASGDESVTLRDPEPGVYIAEIDGFAAGQTGSPSDYAFDYYDIDASAKLGNLKATPNPVPVTSNQKATYTLSWSGLLPDARYLGVVEYAGATDDTVLRVLTTGAAPTGGPAPVPTSSVTPTGTVAPSP